LYDLNLSPSEFPTLFLENGRVLIDDAGFLVSKVLANKRLSDGRRSTVIDAGVNLLFTSFWFKHKVRPAQVSSTYTESATLYGPLCMNIDIIRDDVVLPTLKKGEYLVIMYVGAYSVTQWMQFITLRPNIIMVTEEGKIEQLRKSENLDYIMEQEILPEKLKEFSL
jgi:diaminopimelate decarboxylase